MSLTSPSLNSTKLFLAQMNYCTYGNAKIIEGVIHRFVVHFIPFPGFEYPFESSVKNNSVHNQADTSTQTSEGNLVIIDIKSCSRICKESQTHRHHIITGSHQIFQT